MAERNNIYYWKCDRPSAFQSIQQKTEKEVDALLTDFFKSDAFDLSSGPGQGNHLTFIAVYRQKKYFIRLENGPEGDEYMEIEAEVMKRLQNHGVPTPRIYAVDSSRKCYPFAYQIMEYLEYTDINEIYKDNQLDVLPIMQTLGEYMARWQKLTFDGFGPFNIGAFRQTGELTGLHNRYMDYYMLNLDKHLHFLVERRFMSSEKQKDIFEEVREHERFLDISYGSLVHKDIAFWNVMGDGHRIQSIIDWDDAISGDPTDDISLMACFHSTKEINAIMDGYQMTSPLPDNFFPRFWLHLLRNMIVKAVIRVGAGYFDRVNDFFLFSPQYRTGKEFQDFTVTRLNKALEGLKKHKEIVDI